MVKGFIRRVTFNICILSAVLMGSVVSSNAASALASQSETGFQFTFNSSITLTLSSPDLIISHITPGNYANSNTISVNVSTNNRTGYTLVAKVGDKTSSTLNNNNLVNTTSDANFTSLATTDNKALADFDDGKWGYTIAPTIASATTYSGLLYNADTIINATRNVAGDPQEGYFGSNSTSFTIGAKAGQAQASGEYTNVINFRSVANVVPDIVMQETNLSELATVMPNAGDTAMFVDNRDGSRYTIGKLADGKYWMLENLALDPATLKSGVTLDSSNTNLSAGKTFALPNSTKTGFEDAAASYTTKAINTESKNTSQSLAVGQSGTGKIGVYYNYCAATAGTYCFEKTHTDTNNATNDICPKGWRLPTGGASGEFQALRNQYASAGEYALALRTPLSGYFYDGSARNQGSYGVFWSSTYRNATNMYRLNVDTTGVDPQSSRHRLYGFSVRCVFGSTMQNVTYSDLAAMMPNAGNTATLMDSRDGKSYTIGKINGQYWMTQNLDLAGGTTLTPADSNVSSNYTLPTSSTSGFDDDTKAFVYNSGSTTCGNNSPCYSYYSYVAATAGTGPSDGSGPATSDICPRGWRLPTDEENYNLVLSYSTGTALTAAPWYGVYAGYYSNSSLNSGGTVGMYWSSIAHGTNASNMAFNSSSADWATFPKSHGDAVRCVKIPAMQDVTSSQLSTMMLNVGDTTTLLDARDGQTYTVGKLADGKYWMLDNLALGSDTDMTLTNANTNMTASSWTLQAGVTSGMTVYDQAMINVVSKDITRPLAMGRSGTGKVGVYYNYCAATVGTYCYASGSGTGNASPDNDICPKNWRMPTGGSSGEYQALRNEYSSDGAFVAALKTPLSGNFYNSSALSQGSDGSFWSSTRGSGSYMYLLGVNTSIVNPQNYLGRYYGLSVRCLFK